MATEFRVIPQGNGYTVIAAVPSGTVAFADSRYFRDSAELLNFLDATAHPITEVREAWAQRIAKGEPFSIFI